MDVVGKMLDANKRLQTRLEDAEQKIKTQAEEIRNQQFEARTDALTRLANRRAFDAFLVDSTQLFATHRQPFSLVMFDVDNFKQFNDVHGHPAGDEVLRTVGRTLARAVNTGDLACRYGGEEFAVILTNTSLAEGQLAAERIRKAIEGMSVQFGGNVLRVTASVGVAGCLASEEPATLVRRADEAVYGAKKNGRNCCFWHDGEVARLYAATKPATAEIVAKTSAAPKSFPNRALFADELGRRIAESQRFGVPLTLVHFRVRDYSHLEHTYGNAVGTLLIDSLASFVQSTLRDMDLLARLEGGELIVMLPGSSASAAKIVGQRVRTSISLCPVPLGDHQIRLELDMGVASVQPGEDARTAMESARHDLDATAAVEAQERQQSAELSAV
jgi:diguanylate cyclase